MRFLMSLNLELAKVYRDYDIYKNEDGNFVVFDLENDPTKSVKVAREAVRLFIKNDIPINLPIISLRTDAESARFDIDFAKMMRLYGLE